MLFLWIISLSLLGLYVLRIITYVIGWYRTGRLLKKQESWPGVSIVIPVRDEGSNIDLLLADLVKQDYPVDLLEIILVDDHSGDSTRAKIKSFLEKHRGLRLIQLGSLETGKKAALEKGISASGHPLILNTDGDCRASKSWVSEMVAGFSDPEVKMIIGAVVFEPDKGIFHAMQSLEYFSLTASTAGSAGLNAPILCSGANLAYYRDDYLEFIAEQEKVSESGDDIFLLLWLKKRYPGAIRFSHSVGSVIRTLPSENFSSLIAQRVRWTSKSKYYRDFDILSTALLIFGLNAFMLSILLVFLLVPLFTGIWNPQFLLVFGIVLFCKSSVDLLILVPVLRHYHKTRLLRYFVPMEIIYLVYVSLAGLTGQFLSFSWKGRKITITAQNESLGDER